VLAAHATANPNRRLRENLQVEHPVAVRHAFEAAGVEFIDENGGGPGVRLKERIRPKSTK